MPPPPNRAVTGSWVPTTAIPSALRDWGYFPDLTAWHPGDLILTRSFHPEMVSRLIAEVQELGYGKERSTWTHAAVYLGHGIVLCEAQIDPPTTSRVILTPLWEYLGTHELLVKRSRFASEVSQGWAIAMACATLIDAAYDVSFILRMALDRAFLGDAVWLKNQVHKISPKALVCSSLYSTAHAYATNVTITDKMNGLCVPAYLAGLGSPFLDEVQYDWLRIQG